MTRLYTHTSETAAVAAVAALPGLLAADGEQVTPAPTPALPGRLNALRARLGELADLLTADTWQTVKTELLTLSQPAADDGAGAGPT